MSEPIKRPRNFFQAMLSDSKISLNKEELELLLVSLKPELEREAARFDSMYRLVNRFQKYSGSQD